MEKRHKSELHKTNIKGDMFSMKCFHRYLYLLFIPISLACATLSGQRTPLPSSTENANNNSTNNDYILSNLVSRDPSLWFPSQTILDTDGYIAYKGEYSKSNSEAADGDQDKLNILNNYGRIVSFGHEWELSSGDRLGPKYYYKSSYAILMKSTDGAKEYFEYLKQRDSEDSGLFSMEDVTIGDGGYLFIAEYEDNLYKGIGFTYVEVLFRRDNVLVSSQIETFVDPDNLSKLNIQNLAKQSAEQIDKAIVTEASQHQGSQADIENLSDLYFSSTTTQTDLGNANNYLSGSLSCEVVPYDWGSGYQFDVYGTLKNTGQYRMIVTITTGEASSQISLSPGESQYITQSIGLDLEGTSTGCAATASAEWDT